MADGWNIVTSTDNMRLASCFDVMVELYMALYERLAVQYLNTHYTFNTSFLRFDNMKQAIADFETHFQPNAYHNSIWAGFMNPDKESYITTTKAGKMFTPEIPLDMTWQDIQEKLGITDLIPVPDRFDGEHFRAWAFERRQILDLLKWVALYQGDNFWQESSYNAAYRYTDRASIMYQGKREGSYAVDGNIPSWEQAEANFANSPWVVYGINGVPDLQQVQYQYQIYFYYNYPHFGDGTPYTTYFKEVGGYSGIIDNKFRFSIPAKVEMYAKYIQTYGGSPYAKHGDLLINPNTWYKVKDLPDTATYNTVITYPSKEYYDLTGQPNPQQVGIIQNTVCCRYVVKYDGEHGFKFKNS